MCVCFRASLSIWALPRLSGTERESSVKDTIRQGVKGRGREEWMVGRERCVGGERKKPD